MDLGRDELDGPAWTQPRKVFGASGGAVAYRRSMLEEIGFLDPDFVMIYEDADLSFRAQLRGHGCVYVPGAIVYHRYRVTIGKAPSRQVYYSQRNIEFVYLKNMPLGLILQSAPQRLLYEVGAAIYFSKQGAGSAFFRAKLDVLKLLAVNPAETDSDSERKDGNQLADAGDPAKRDILPQMEEVSLGLDQASSIGG